MKDSGKCGKCEGQDILQIAGESGAYGSGNNIPIGMTIFSAVKVTRYVCIGCGFTEEWIDSSEDIAKLVKKFRD